MKLPGISHSFLKGFSGPPSAGMSLGTRVHNYLMEPGKYDWQDVDAVKEIASCLRAQVGPAFEFLKHEVAVTADFTQDDFTMAYRGRFDSGFLPKIVIDYKVLSGPLLPAIERFGYRNALSGYCIATGSDLGLILAYNRKTKKCEKYCLAKNMFATHYWQNAVITNGKPHI